jgi:TonB family protein
VRSCQTLYTIKAASPKSNPTLQTKKMKILLILSLLISFQLVAQTEAESKLVLTKIHNKANLDSMKTIFPDWQIYPVTISPFGSRGDTNIANSPIGSVHEVSYEREDYNYLLKVLSKETREFCKVSYIQVNSSDHRMDSTKLSNEEINTLQDKIISEYESGQTIADLAKKYTKNYNLTGELPRFDNIMLTALEKEVFNEPINSVIKVNLSRMNLHFVVFKTHANLEAEVANCVRVRLCPNGCRDPYPTNWEIPEPKIREKKAAFPGGEEALAKFISDELKYPKKAYRKRIEGTVTVSFVIEPDGSLTNRKIIKGVNEALDNEALRLIELMPNWTPQIAHDRIVRARRELPIEFAR